MPLPMAPRPMRPVCNRLLGVDMCWVLPLGESQGDYAGMRSISTPSSLMLLPPELACYDAAAIQGRRYLSAYSRAGTAAARLNQLSGLEYAHMRCCRFWLDEDGRKSRRGLLDRFRGSLCESGTIEVAELCLLQIRGEPRVVVIIVVHAEHCGFQPSAA